MGQAFLRWAIGPVCTAAVLLGIAAGCGPVTNSPDVRPTDGAALDGAGSDEGTVDVPADAQRCSENAQCSDGMYCNGEERCQGGFCVAGRAPCDDGHACTMDSCDEAGRMCTNAPDDSMCGDRNACNGVERCNPAAAGALPTGCEPVRPDNVLDCDDSNTCTIDTCDTTGGCVHAPRDLDGDGFVDRTCTVDGTPSGPPGDDCNDGDPTVYPAAPEICNDSRDNNCDGRTDYADTRCVPSNDTCATATMLPGPGTYSGSTVGLANDYALSCNTGSFADAVFVFTLAATQDVTISTSGGTGSNAAVALVSDCAAPLTELRCNRNPTTGGSPSLRIRSLAAGTYRIIAETGTAASAFRLTLRFDAPTATPPDEVCPVGAATMPAFELMSGVDRRAPLSTLEDDHVLSCNTGTPRRDAVYRITLAAPGDVLLNITPPTPSFSTTYVSFRNSPCAPTASERRCLAQSGTTPFTLNQRGLPAGTYWVIVENSLDQDVTVRATVTTPPAPRPTQDICPAVEPNPAVELVSGAATPVDFATLEDDYVLSCNSFATNIRDAVYRITLTAPSDVLLRATSTIGTNYVSFRNAPCAVAASERRCASGATTAGATISQRALAAGTYWVIVENSSNQPVTLTATITTPPAPRPTEDVCPATEPSLAIEISDGMVRTVTLAALEDDYVLSCNMFGGVRRDAVYRVTTTAASDVRITASSSTGTTYLSWRNPPCATGASERRCVIGTFAGSASLVERSLPAGTYWLVVENSSDAAVTLTATVSPPAPIVNYALSMSPAGVAWTDVCAMAGSTRVLMSVDDAQAAVPMGTVPFPLRMYGNPIATALTISSNGWMSLTAGASGALSGTLPDPSLPNLTLAPAWTDQTTTAMGVCYGVVGTAPNRRFIVEWPSQNEYGGGATGLAYEVIINEQASASGNNIIDFVYNAFAGATRTYSAGVENEDGTAGTNVTMPLTAPRVVRFTPSM